MILVFSRSRLLLSRVVTVGSKIVHFLTVGSRYSAGLLRGVRQPRQLSCLDFEKQNVQAAVQCDAMAAMALRQSLRQYRDFKNSGIPKFKTI